MLSGVLDTAPGPLHRLDTALDPRRYIPSDAQLLSILAALSNIQSSKSGEKPIFNAPMKRRAASPEPFDDFDSENVDPNIFLSPSKRTKGLDGSSFIKAPKFALVDAKPVAFTANAAPVTKRPSSLSVSIPSTANVTPIARSRGSPKHKRVGLLSNRISGEKDLKRRHSSSPYRRIDPASSKRSSLSSIPFSIDAALSGTISSYTPAAEPAVPAVQNDAPAALEKKPMPSTWFFEIHEDTADEEAANMMEHSASILDIGSDDDAITKSQRDFEDVGKENVPPPDFVAPVRAQRGLHAINASITDSLEAVETDLHKGISNKAKAAAKKALAVDAIFEDRCALKSLDADDFYPEGLDEKSVEIVDAAAEKKEAEAPVVAAVAPSQSSPAGDSLKRGREDDE